MHCMSCTCAVLLGQGDDGYASLTVIAFRFAKSSAARERPTVRKKFDTTNDAMYFAISRAEFVT